jgi:hypothetical protein
MSDYRIENRLLRKTPAVKFRMFVFEQVPDQTKIGP